MKKQLRSSFSTQGRRMAGARALWAANGMKKNETMIKSGQNLKIPSKNSGSKRKSSKGNSSKKKSKKR